MSSAVPFHFTTTTSTAAIPVRSQQSANLKGLSASNAATANYLKFYWFTPASGSNAPTVGTTVPNLTIGMAASANVLQSFPDGITGNGELWVAVTGAAADNDTTAATAGAVITLLVE